MEGGGEGWNVCSHGSCSLLWSESACSSLASPEKNSKSLRRTPLVRFRRNGSKCVAEVIQRWDDGAESR